MTKTFEFGKIDYNGIGKKNCSVEVCIDLKQREKGPIFTAWGIIYTPYRKFLSSGQNLDEIYEFLKGNKKFRTIHRLWNRYHMNDMHPECGHQRELGWREKAKEEVTQYEFILKPEILREKNSLEEKALEEIAKYGKYEAKNEREKRIFILSNFIKSWKEEPNSDIAEYYKLYKTETKTLGWLRPDEHPDGILTKECPVCGYKYGSEWKYVSIPDEDMAIINELFSDSSN